MERPRNNIKISMFTDSENGDLAAAARQYHNEELYIPGIKNDKSDVNNCMSLEASSLDESSSIDHDDRQEDESLRVVTVSDFYNFMAS